MNINLQNTALAVTAGKAAQFPRRAIPQVALIGDEELPLLFC